MVPYMDKAKVGSHLKKPPISRKHFAFLFGIIVACMFTILSVLQTGEYDTQYKLGSYDEIPHLVDLSEDIRVLCWVMTTPANHNTKAIHVKQTWGRRCNKLLLMSSTEDDQVGTIALPVGEGRESLWNKTREAFRYVYDHHLNEYDWFMKADDDTYVIMENLRYFLYPYSSDFPIFFGSKFRYPEYVSQGYFSGGAGYVLSKEALKRFVEQALNSTDMCSTAYDTEDLEMGRCMESVNVTAGDSRDLFGRKRFLPMEPLFHLTANPSVTMSYIGNASDVEQEKNLTEYRRQRSSSNLLPAGSKSVGSPKLSDVLWNDKRANQGNQTDDDDSEMSDSENFLAKGAFLLTPSHELSMDRAALICEKMNFKGCFSLTKTATGILFKFSNPEDYQAVFKKGFHKVTGARFYKKVAIPCRPQKTFMLYVFDVPDDVPVDDIRHSLYRFNSVVEVVRLVVQYQKQPGSQDPEQMQPGTATPKPQMPKLSTTKPIDEQDVALQRESPPPPIRITLASIDEYHHLLQNGLDFYGATFFPTEPTLPAHAAKIATKKGSRMIDGSIPGRVRELLPVFDAAGFSKIPPPASKTIKPRP